MSHKRMRRPEHYKTITPEVASHIIELHKHHLRLGHDGLLKLLTEHGEKVDPEEYTSFIEQHKIHGEKWELAWGYIPGRWRLWGIPVTAWRLP